MVVIFSPQSKFQDFRYRSDRIFDETLSGIATVFSSLELPVGELGDCVSNIEFKLSLCLLGGFFDVYLRAGRAVGLVNFHLR